MQHFTLKSTTATPQGTIILKKRNNYSSVLCWWSKTAWVGFPRAISFDLVELPLKAAVISPTQANTSALLGLVTHKSSSPFQTSS